MNTVTLMRYPHFAPAEHSRLLFAAMLVVRRIRRHLRVGADRRLLQSMPDSMLADIGLSRSGIDRAVQYGRLNDGRR